MITMQEFQFIEGSDSDPISSQFNEYVDTEERDGYNLTVLQMAALASRNSEGKAVETLFVVFNCNEK